MENGLKVKGDIITSNHAAFIVDGGYLLLRVFWDGETFRDIIKQYEKYLKVNYGVCTVVFDGYRKDVYKRPRAFKKVKQPTGKCRCTCFLKRVQFTIEGKNF